MSYHKRNLPHWQPSEATFFVTFRLTNSLPKEAVERLRFEKKFYEKNNLEPSYIKQAIFKKFEDLIDKGLYGPIWLSNNKIAAIVDEAIKYRDGKKYDLYAYCIMPNHVHMVCKLIYPANEPKKYPLSLVLQSLKRHTAREANKILQRQGQFWQHESYDRVVRNMNELERVISYVLNNPVKAGLIDLWDNWPYSYCKTEFVDTFK